MTPNLNSRTYVFSRARYKPDPLGVSRRLCRRMRQPAILDQGSSPVRCFGCGRRGTWRNFLLSPEGAPRGDCAVSRRFRNNGRLLYSLTASGAGRRYSAHPFRTSGASKRTFVALGTMCSSLRLRRVRLWKVVQRTCGTRYIRGLSGEAGESQ